MSELPIGGPTSAFVVHASDRRYAARGTPRDMRVMVHHYAGCTCGTCCRGGRSVHADRGACVRPGTIRRACTVSALHEVNAVTADDAITSRPEPRIGCGTGGRVGRYAAPRRSRRSGRSSCSGTGAGRCRPRCWARREEASVILGGSRARRLRRSLSSVRPRPSDLGQDRVVAGGRDELTEGGRGAEWWSTRVPRRPRRARSPARRAGMGMLVGLGGTIEFAVRDNA